MKCVPVARAFLKELLGNLDSLPIGEQNPDSKVLDGLQARLLTVLKEYEDGSLSWYDRDTVLALATGALRVPVEMTRLSLQHANEELITGALGKRREDLTFKEVDDVLVKSVEVRRGVRKEYLEREIAKADVSVDAVVE